MVDIIVQFSIFSIASNKTEILDINKKLIALYDRCSITASGWKQIFMELANGEGEVTEYPMDTITGTGKIYQSDVDFNVRLLKN
jgi:regulator of RNase E activity RraB